MSGAKNDKPVALLSIGDRDVRRAAEVGLQGAGFAVVAADGADGIVAQIDRADVVVVDPEVVRDGSAELVQRAADERRRTEIRAARARRMARFATWEWSLETGDFSCDTELLGIFECSTRPGAEQIAAILERVHPSDVERVRAAWETRKPHQLEYRVVLAGTRKLRIVKQEAELAQDEGDGVVRLVGTVQDVTPLKEAERKVSRLAYFDGLTGLPNRAFLREHLLRVVANARRHRVWIGVLAVDLDRFKRVNETLGRDAGDRVLVEVSRRIRETVREGDAVVVGGGSGTLDLHNAPGDGSVIARLGADEFIVVLNHLRSSDEAAVVARRIADRVAMGISVEGTEVFIGCSVGIALHPENGDTPDALLEQAISAVNHAKEQGRNNFQFFTASINERAVRRMTLESGIRSALSKGEFLVYYQPKVDMLTGRTLGVEALLRWRSANGMVSPAEFVPVAEDTGLIVPIGEWVLRTACAQARAWHDLGWTMPVAVNVSGRQFRDADLAEVVSNVLLETRLPPHLLELEITEGVIMQDTAGGIAILQRLKALGVRVALDDFGTGYSSLSYLSRFPVDELKIDRSFVKELGTQTSCEGITAAIVALSRTLSLGVVAEGVETRLQMDFLLKQGCTVCQGFAFSPAVPAKDVALKYPVPRASEAPLAAAGGR